MHSRQTLIYNKERFFAWTPEIGFLQAKYQLKLRNLCVSPCVAAAVTESPYQISAT